MFNTQRHGLKVYLRDPNSFTPLRGTDKSLLLGNNMRENEKQIAQFSVRDAEVNYLLPLKIPALTSVSRRMHTMSTG